MKIVLIGEEYELKIVYDLLMKKEKFISCIELCCWNNYTDVQNLKK